MRNIAFPLIFAIIAVGGIFSTTLTIDKPAYMSVLETAVLDELNLARTNPKTYAKLLGEYRNTFEGKIAKRSGKVDLMTSEGTRAVDEAIRALRSQPALTAMRPSKGMSLAARDHVKNTGPSGATGHTGKDGSSPFDRMNRHGKWQLSAGENISYGNDEGRAVIIQLIVDDGVPSRGHRTNIFSKKFNVVGIACGPHKIYNTMCVQTFAGDYEEK